MRLVHEIHLVKVVDFHVKRLLILTNALHLAHEQGALDIVPLKRLNHQLDGFVFIQVLWLIDFFSELCGLIDEFGHFLRNLLLHHLFSFVGLLTGLAKFMAEFGLQLVCRLNLALSSLLLSSD